MRAIRYSAANAFPIALIALLAALPLSSIALGARPGELSRMERVREVLEAGRLSVAMRPALKVIHVVTSKPAKPDDAEVVRCEFAGFGFTLTVPATQSTLNAAFQAKGEPPESQTYSAVDVEQAGKKTTRLTFPAGEYNLEFGVDHRAVTGSFKLYINEFPAKLLDPILSPRVIINAERKSSWAIVQVRLGVTRMTDVDVNAVSYSNTKEDAYAEAVRYRAFSSRFNMLTLRIPPLPPSFDDSSRLKNRAMRQALGQTATNLDDARKVVFKEADRLQALSDHDLFKQILAASADDLRNAQTPGAAARAVLLLCSDGPYSAPAYVWSEGKTTRYALAFADEPAIRVMAFDEKDRFMLQGTITFDPKTPDAARWKAVGQLFGVDFAHPLPAPTTRSTTAPTTAPTTGPSTGPTTRAAAATPRPATAATTVPATIPGDATVSMP